MITRDDFSAPKTLDNEGNASANEVFASVGNALSQWEHIEESLASLFAFLVGPGGPTHAAFRAYGTLTATLPRRKMIEAAAEVYFSHFPGEALAKRLSDILTLYGDAGGRRNEIAHGVVMGPQKHIIKDKKAIPLPPSWYLFPAIHNTKKQSLQLEGEFRFNSHTIDRFAKTFDAFNSEIIGFRGQMIVHYESFPRTLRAQY